MKAQIWSLWLVILVSWEASHATQLRHRKPALSAALQASSFPDSSSDFSTLKKAMNTTDLLRASLRKWDVHPIPTNVSKFSTQMNHSYLKAFLRAEGQSHSFNAAFSSELQITSNFRQPAEGHYGAYKSRIKSCKDCVGFYPKIEQGGSPDGHYRKWPAQCYVGDCDFEDPWAAGIPDKSCGDAGWECWYWGLQNMCKDSIYGGTMRILCKATCNTCTGQKYCFSRDPIAKYDDCQQVLYADATQVMDLSRVCEYNHQIQVMSNPQVWFGNIKPFTIYKNMGSEELDCTKIIQDGGLVYKDDDSFDTRKAPGRPELPLGTCCERVHKYFTCVGNPEKEKLIAKDAEGLSFLDQVSFSILAAFNSYCQPLFLYPTKAQFCAQYPTSDPCIVYNDCEACTEHKGVWCPEKKSCMSHEAPKCTVFTKPEHCPSYATRMEHLHAAPLTPSTTTVTTTTTVIIPDHNWWYQIIGAGNYFSKDYIPSPHISVKQGHPGNFMPESS